MGTSKRKTANPSRPHVVGTVARWARLLAVWGLLAVALFVGNRMLWDAHRSRLLAQPRFHLTPEEIEVGDLPPWIHEDPRAEFLLSVAGGADLNLAADDALTKLVQAIEKHPWVRKVESAEKRFPGLVTVKLEWRMPVAMVRVQGGLLPVDREGVLLPTRDFTPLEAARYPRIEGVSEPPPGPAGVRWLDPVVLGGSRLAALLLPVWSKYQFRALIPLKSGGTSAALDFAIRTRGGSVILWGDVPPEGVGAAEKVTAAKLQWLEAYFREHGSFEGVEGPQEIDLRPAKPRIGPLGSGI